MTSSWFPRPGTALVRPIQTRETLPGGRIVLTQTMRDSMTANQMELVAMGIPAPRDEPDPDLDCLDRQLQSLSPGAWLVVKPRTWIELDSTHTLFLLPHEAIVAVLR